MPRCLRDKFAVMIHMCNFSDPLALWDAHKEALSEDFLYRRRRLTSQNDLLYSDLIFNEALICIEDKILSFPSGKHLPEYGIPAPDRTRHTLSSETPREILAEQSYDQTEMTHIVESRTPSLTPDQSDVYRTICQLADSQQPDNRQGHLIFLDAPGGTGKTYLLNLILAKFRSRGDIALAVASSGIAATLLQGGKTAHSTFKLPLDLATNEYPSCDISRGSAKAQLLARAKIIVWDECTMSHRGAFEALDRTLRDIRQNDTIMGGIILLLAGDFRQILPVIKRGTRLDQVRESLKSSRTLWPHVRIMNLHTNMRLRIDNDDDARQYSELLLRIGNGLIPPDDQNLIQVPCGHPVHSSQQLQDAVFPDLACNYTDTTWLSNRAILAPNNEVVADINDSLIQQLPTNAKEYLSIDKPADIDAAILYPVELLNSLLPSGLPPHRLYLKEGAPIILLRNLDAPRLCNGTKLIITRLRRNVIEATIAMGQYKNESVFIPRIPLIPSDALIPFKRLQFPIRLCFAMTINKAQGQTLETAGLSLRSHCFSHGQFYVACSRVRAPDNLFILTENNKTKNMVYHEIFN